MLRVLGNLLDLHGFDYQSSTEIRDEVARGCPENSLLEYKADFGSAQGLQLADAELVRVGDVPIYAADGLVRRADALQETVDAESLSIRLNVGEAERRGLRGADQAVVAQDGASVKLPVAIDPRVPDGCVWLAAGVPGSEGLGGQIAPIRLERD